MCLAETDCALVDAVVADRLRPGGRRDCQHTGHVTQRSVTVDPLSAAGCCANNPPTKVKQLLPAVPLSAQPPGPNVTGFLENWPQ